VCLALHCNLIFAALAPIVQGTSNDDKISPWLVASTTRATIVTSCDKKESPRSVVIAVTAEISIVFFETSAT